MNILYLKYAVAVAKAGSFSKAAEALCIVQPNLSRAIKELERDLNITIFERSPKGIFLTPDGEKLIQYGKHLLREIDNVESIFKDNSEEKKRFSISVPRASYIGDAFSRFSLSVCQESNVEILYKETNALRAIRNIEEENYNLGILRYGETYEKHYRQLLEEKGFHGELVTEFKYVLSMSKENPLASLPEIHFSDLEKYIEIAHADPYVPSLPMAAVRKEELPDNIKRRIFVFERASEYEVLSRNTSTFMWVSPTPQETMDRYGLVLRVCNENKKRYKDVMIYKRDYKLSDLDKDFIKELNYSKKNCFNA